MEKANFTSVVDTPEIIHAQQVKNLSSQKKYKEDAEKSMSYYETVLDTPEMQRVRENQKNFSNVSILDLRLSPLVLNSGRLRKMPLGLQPY